MIVVVLAVVAVGAVVIAMLSIQKAMQRRRDEQEALVSERQHLLMNEIVRDGGEDIGPRSAELPRLDTGQEILDDLEQIQDEAS